MRAFVVARSGPVTSRTAVTVLVDRLAGLIGLVGVAWIGLAAAPGELPRNALAVGAWISAAFAAGGTVIAASALRDVRLGRPIVPAAIEGPMRVARDQVGEFLRRRGLLVMLLLCGLVFQALTVVRIMVGASDRRPARVPYRRRHSGPRDGRDGCAGLHRRLLRPGRHSCNDPRCGLDQRHGRGDDLPDHGSRALVHQPPWRVSPGS